MQSPCYAQETETLTSGENIPEHNMSANFDLVQLRGLETLKRSFFYQILH